MVRPHKWERTGMICRALWLAVIVTLALWRQHARPVAATCVGPEYTRIPTQITWQKVATVPFVLEGTVLEHSPAPPDQQGWSPTKAIIRVHQYLKGKGPATIELEGFNNGSTCDQAYAPAIGTRLIFYANHDGTSLRLYTYGGLEAATAEQLAVIRQAVGQPSTLPLGSAADPVVIILIGLILVGLALAGVGALRARPRRR